MMQILPERRTLPEIPSHGFPCFFPEQGDFPRKTGRRLRHERAITKKDQGFSSFLPKANNREKTGRKQGDDSHFFLQKCPPLPPCLFRLLKFQGRNPTIPTDPRLDSGWATGPSIGLPSGLAERRRRA